MHTLWWIRAKGSINIQRWLGSASVNGRQQDLCSDRSRMRNGIFSFLSVRFFFLSLPPPSPPPPHTDRRGAGSYGGRGVTFKIHQKTNKVIFWRLLRGIRYCSCLLLCRDGCDCFFSRPASRQTWLLAFWTLAQIKTENGRKTWRSFICVARLTDSVQFESNCWRYVQEKKLSGDLVGRAVPKALTSDALFQANTLIISSCNRSFLPLLLTGDGPGRFVGTSRKRTSEGWSAATSHDAAIDRTPLPQK